MALPEPKLPERQREHEANHIRTLEQQILDALLRIEELLAQHFDGDADRPPAEGVGGMPQSFSEPKPKRTRK